MTDTPADALAGVTVTIIPAADDALHRALANGLSGVIDKALDLIAADHGDALALDALVVAYTRKLMVTHRLQEGASFARELLRLADRLKMPLNAMATGDGWSERGGIKLYTTAPHREVSARVRGAFAVHPSADGKSDYTLTHLPTGSSLAAGGGRDALMALAERLDRYDWDWTDPHSDAARKALAETRPVVAAFVSWQGDAAGRG